MSVARVGDVDGLKPVMARLAEHLDAVGLIVWLEDASSQRLTPIVTHGYPAETLAHLPPIDLDADNATARAWRLAELQIVAGRGNQPGAIVVPMPSSAGCVGVVAAEVRHGREHDPATLALARILAAQLAMLTGAARLTAEDPSTRPPSGARDRIPCPEGRGSGATRSAYTTRRTRGAASGSSIVAFNVIGFLSRVTLNVTSFASPSVASAISRRRSPASFTGLPFTAVMTSPAFTPALAAAELSSTWRTSTPDSTPK